MSNLFSRSSLRANIVTAATAAFFLAACGGDGNKANEPAPSAEADFVVDSFDDLSVCIGNREGATAYVKDEDNAYICTNGDWAIDTNADTRKKSSNSKDNTKSSSSRYKDCKDEANSNSNFSGQKTAWEYLNPNIDYGEIVDDRDCQTYKTVKIGNQVWMAENLNFETENSWCGGGKDSTEGDCSKYGRLYTWAAAVGKSEDECGYGKTCGLSGKVRGVCPEGWHLPDTTEWSKLFTAVGGISEAGKILKSQTGWNDYNGTSGNGMDAYGFSALSAGLGDSTGYFYTVNECASFWSAPEKDSNYAYNVGLFYNYGIASLYYNIKYGAYSVRCLKDDP